MCRLIYAACAAAFLLPAVITAVAWQHDWQSHQSLAPIKSIRMRKTVAVLGFQNLSERTEDAWLATALSEMLSSELARGEKLRLVSGEDIEHLRVSDPWPTADSLNGGTSRRIGTALNSDVLVLGSYLLIGTGEHRQLRLDMRMQDGKSGEMLFETTEVGSTEDLFHLVSQIGVELRSRLEVESSQGSEPGPRQK